MKNKEAMELARKLEDFCYDQSGCYCCPFRIYSAKEYLCAMDGKPGSWNLDFSVGFKEQEHEK